MDIKTKAAVLLRLVKVILVAAILYPGICGAGQKLVVATKQAPPFAMQGANGVWHGLSIDLWDKIAADLNWEYTLEQRDLNGLLTGVQDGSVDLAVAALTITSEREELFDFSHPFYTSGLGIGVRTDDRGSWMSVVKRVFSPEFIRVLLSLLLVLLLFGVLVWFFERKHNREQFGGNVVNGVGAGLWWSAVTMTTVGYGDKAPVTLGGRIVAMVWMFTAIIIISSFTAAITSVLTISGLESRISGPEDLGDVRVASVDKSTSAKYLERQHINFLAYSAIEPAMAGLGAGRVDAVVYDAPILRYLSSQSEGSIHVLPQTFEHQAYGIGMPAGSALREDINRKLLEITNSTWWKDRLFHYLNEK